MKEIYLDNAATSFPKAPLVGEAMKNYVEKIGVNINRSVYGRAEEAGLAVLKTREQLKSLFRFPGRVSHVVFTPGNTYALNTIIKGYLKPGDHVLVSSMEHNAVMRPLLSMPDIAFDRIPCDNAGRLNPDGIAPLIKSNTRLCILAHASNVSGTVQNVEVCGNILRKFDIPLVLDAAQTAGHIPVDFTALGLSALCVPGHKGLLGPAGIGALLMTEEFAAKTNPLITGGTGSASHTEQQPAFMPDKFESGTENIPGIYGLSAALSYLERTGLENIRTHEDAMAKRFLDGLAVMQDIAVIGPKDMQDRTGVISVDFLRLDNAEAAETLEHTYGILTRCGLHCAPHAHKTLGTFPCGTVRFSVGYATTETEIDAALKAIDAVAHTR